MATPAGAYLKSIFLRRRWTVLTATPLLVTGWQWLVNHLSLLPSDLRTASVWTAPWWAWIIAFLLCFAVAQCLAWYEEYKKSCALEKVIQDTNYPALSGAIIQTNVHSPARDATGYSCGVLIVAEIRNVGADSVIDAYSLTVTINNQEIVGDPWAIVDTVTLVGDASVKYVSQDALYNKTLTPVVRGGKATGILWFMFKEVTSETMRLNLEGLTLYFSDVRQKRWSIKLGGRPKKAASPFVPGITTEVLPVKQPSTPGS